MIDSGIPASSASGDGRVGAASRRAFLIGGAGAAGVLAGGLIGGNSPRTPSSSNALRLGGGGGVEPEVVELTAATSTFLPVLQLSSFAPSGQTVANAVLTTASTTAASNLATVPGIGSSANGMAITIDGAGAGGQPLVTTIVAATNGVATLSTIASASVSNAQTVYGNDDTQAWNNMLQAWYAQNGGIMTWQGISLVVSSVTVPNNNTRQTDPDGLTLPGGITQIGPWQPPGRITGQGAYFDGQWGGQLLTSGSILVLCNQNSGAASFITEGTGILELDHFTMLMLGSDTLPAVLTTNTTVHAHHLSVSGRASKLQGNCKQTFLVCGGNGAIGTGSGAAFQGYGTKISDCYFDKINTVVSANTSGNGIVATDNVISFTCGGLAPFNLVGPSSTSLTLCHHLGPNVVEMGGYTYAYYLKNVQDSRIDASGVADGGTAIVHCDSGATNNVILGSYQAIPLLDEAAAVSGTNRAIQNAKYCCTVGMTGTGQSISPNQYVQAAWNSVISDPFSMFSSSEHSITAPVQGLYEVSARVVFDGNAPSGYQFYAGIYHNATSGTDQIPGLRTPSGPIGGITISHQIRLKQNDYVGISVACTGPTMNLEPPNCTFSLTLLD